MTYFFVDCEAYGGAPSTGALTEFGCVAYPGRETFHGRLIETVPEPSNPAIPKPTGRVFDAKKVFTDFDIWLTKHAPDQRIIMISDNPAFDFMWIAFEFHKHLGRNPFGHSARRIGDFYAGLVGNFSSPQKWKRLRITAHTHDPVMDAMGNLEAFERLMSGER